MPTSPFEPFDFFCSITRSRFCMNVLVWNGCMVVKRVVSLRLGGAGLTPDRPIVPEWGRDECRMVPGGVLYRDVVPTPFCEAGDGTATTGTLY